MGQAVSKPMWAIRVEEVLAAQRKSRRWLAWMLEMDDSQLYHIMTGTGRYRMAESEAFQSKIAKYLGVPVSWLFRESDTPIAV